MRNVLFKLLGLGHDGSRREIDVVDNETVLGRGTFLSVSDKRVSRSHAVLLVVNGLVKLKSTHSNPCFVALCSTDRKLALKNGGSIALNNGDRFSLLPDEHHFEVMMSSTRIKEVSPSKLVPEDMLQSTKTETKVSAITNTAKTSDSSIRKDKSIDKPVAHKKSHKENISRTVSSDHSNHTSQSNKVAAFQNSAQNTNIRLSVNDNESVKNRTVTDKTLNSSEDHRSRQSKKSLSPNVIVSKEPALVSRHSVPHIDDNANQKSREEYKKSMKRRKRILPSWIKDATVPDSTEITKFKKIPKPIKRPKLGCPSIPKVNNMQSSNHNNHQRNQKSDNISPNNHSNRLPRDELYEESQPIFPNYPTNVKPQASSKNQRHEKYDSSAKQNKHSKGDQPVRSDHSVKQKSAKSQHSDSKGSHSNSKHGNSNDDPGYDTVAERPSRYPANTKYSITRYDAARSASPPPQGSQNSPSQGNSQASASEPEKSRQKWPSQRNDADSESDDEPPHIVRKTPALIPKPTRKHDYNNNTNSKSHKSLINYMNATMNITPPGKGGSGSKNPQPLPNKPPPPNRPGKKPSGPKKPKYRYTPNSAREPCMYGRFCYRKNTDHYGDFSHQGDVDYISPNSSDEDNKLECQYGANCYRKHPLHWLVHNIHTTMNILIPDYKL